MRTKNNEDVQQDYRAYRDWMLTKALRAGMPQAEAIRWAQEQADRQLRLRQLELEERQRGPKRR